MCIRRETWEKARQSLAFSPVSKTRTHITYMLRQCTSIVYLYKGKYYILTVKVIKNYSFIIFILPVFYSPTYRNFINLNHHHNIN